MSPRVPGRSVAVAAAVALSAAAAAQEIQPRMGEPVPGLTAAQVARFDAGKLAFEKTFSPVEGLGPIMNDESCGACHSIPAVGGAGSKVVTRFGNSGPPFDPLAELGGSLLQREFIAPECEEFVPVEANVVINRITPSAFGAGLVEAIRPNDIVRREVMPPPGVSGRAHRVHALEDPPTAKKKVGRFGWKAQVATLLSFSADASLNELGFTNRLLTVENAPNGNQQTLDLCDNVPDPEDGPDAQGFDGIDRQTDFQKFLAQPPQTPRSGMPGEVIFTNIGCAACHVATAYTTASNAEPPLAAKTIKPYSDFLLHDMGDLGDGIVQGDATEDEFRTPSLWGLRSRAATALLHDGRVTGGTLQENLLNAIIAHDGEALASATAFNGLTQPQKDQVVRFLLSLGRAEFDEEGDNDVDDFDWFFLENAGYFTGPGAFFGPDNPQAVADFDQDGDFDLVDFTVMQRAMTGQLVTAQDAKERASAR
jgi:CxxC motif-containing protein (DUF1111 family)